MATGKKLETFPIGAQLASPATIADNYFKIIFGIGEAT